MFVGFKLDFFGYINVLINCLLIEKKK